MKKSYYLLTLKILEWHKASEFELFSNGIQIFSKPLFISNGRSHVIFTLGFVLKWIWIHWRPKARRKVWESRFIPSHLTFKKFSNSTQFRTTNHTSNHYYLINIRFQNLEFWDVTNLPPLEAKLRVHPKSHVLHDSCLTPLVFSHILNNTVNDAFPV